MPTADDWKRMCAVEKRHCAIGVLLAVWTKGRAVKFFRPRAKPVDSKLAWTEVPDVQDVFR
jgi:hypothetical protein